MADVITVMEQLIEQRSMYTLGQAALTPSWTLQLFVNNHTPAVTDTHAAYTICTLPGYSDVALSPTSWSGGIVAGVDTETYPVQTFLFTGGGQTVYGHLLWDAVNNLLAWVSLWDTPFAVPSGGGVVDVQLVWVEKQC